MKTAEFGARKVEANALGVRWDAEITRLGGTSS
jgi:hypothetical protein